MSVRMRQEVERKIVIAVIEAAETVLQHSKNKNQVLNAMFTTDEDRLLLYAHDTKKQTSWVLFIYGNDGYDVVSDYTTNLEPIMKTADKSYAAIVRVIYADRCKFEEIECGEVINRGSF